MALAAATLGGTGIATAVVANAAAAGCRVEYAIASQWNSGFTANVQVTNLGDALTGWRLTFAFPDSGQRTSSAWSATVTQSGTQVTAANVGYNAALAAGGNVSFGFQGSYTGSNPAPTGFTFNGNTCRTGA